MVGLGEDYLENGLVDHALVLSSFIIDGFIEHGKNQAAAATMLKYVRSVPDATGDGFAFFAGTLVLVNQFAREIGSEGLLTMTTSTVESFREYLSADEMAQSLRARAVGIGV